MRTPHTPSDSSQISLPAPDFEANARLVLTELLPPLCEALESATRDTTQQCQAAVAPLIELLVAVDNKDLPLPNSFTPLRNAIENVVRFTHDFSTLWRLDAWEVQWSERLEWIKKEIQDLRQSHVPNEPANLGHVAALMTYRRLFAENEHGTPCAWAEAYATEQQVIANYEIFAPVRLIGAEIALFINRLERVTSTAEFADLPFERLTAHLTCFISDLGDLKERGHSTIDMSGLQEGFSEIAARALELKHGHITNDDFAGKVWNVHQEMCAISIFKKLPPSCKGLKLSLLEFNTDFSGLPTMLIPEIQKIDKGLLIDPKLGKPQEGVGRTMTDQEAEGLLRSCGCRVFLLQSNRESVGYYMFLPSPTNELLPNESLIDALYEKGIVDDERRARFGFARDISVTMENRLRFAHAGVNAADLLDDVMGQTALFENCDTLFGTVRVGDNANTSIKSHVRHGWTRTGIIVYSKGSGGVPLEVIVRDTRKSVLFPREHIPKDKTPDLGLRPHYMPYSPRGRDDARAEQAAVISDADAERRAKQFAATMPGSWHTWTSHGSLQYYVSFMTGALLAHLHQLRPGFDYWYRTTDEGTGTLEECLTQIREWAHSRC